MIIRVVDVFWTLQGEGANWGRRALFIRMPFCNLRCEWCDTFPAFNSFKKMSLTELADFATSEKARFAVITGGEPMMNKDVPAVIDLLKNFGFEIATETNGTFPIVQGIDFVTVSPKRDAEYKVNPHALQRADELKLVVDKDFDFAICKEFEKHNLNCRHTLSPEFGNLEESSRRAIDFIKENPKWRLSLQTHKWLKIP